MATAVGNQPIDPTKGARYPITISEQLLRDEQPKKRQKIGVQCNHQQAITISVAHHSKSNGTSADNHRPKLSSPSKTIIAPSQDNDGYDLSLKSDEKGEYKYTGYQHPSSTVALLYDPSEKAFTLEKLDAEFQFNLRSTPGQQDASRTYPQLDGHGTGAENGHALFDRGSDDEEDREDDTPDPNNPYDYRHFLDKGHRSPSPMPSHASSPVPQNAFNSSPALKASSPQPPKAAALKSRPSRPKQHVNEKPRYLSPKPRREEAGADSEDSDPNGLVIDMGDSAPTTNTRPWRSALGVLNEGGRSHGPISLRSAASSMSPSIRGGSPSEDEKEESDADADADADADDDVEEINLGNTMADPAPAQPEEAATPGNGWDDNDELEAELALALEEDQAKSDIEEAARGRSAALPNGESSEESEEE